MRVRGDMIARYKEGGKTKNEEGDNPTLTIFLPLKTSSSMDHGPIPGIEVGMSWLFRVQCSEEGLHRPPVGGIAAGLLRLVVGCPSLVLAGGYEDHVDEFTYTDISDDISDMHVASEASEDIISQEEIAAEANEEAVVKTFREEFQTAVKDRARNYWFC